MSNLIVETRYGKVQGYEQGAISVWKGIPFAKPPTAQLRFRAPQPPEPWRGVRETTAFSPMAPQVPTMGASMVGALGAERAVDQRPMSEDCLYLNIWSPGADQEKRTVMGESAGAMSIGALLGMPAARGLFRRAILQSGAAGVLPTRSQAAQVAQALLAKLGLEATQLAALAEVPLGILLKIQPELGREFGGVRAYSPVIDGETLPQHPLAMIAQGSAAQVAILAGTNRDEWRLFAMLSGGPQVDEQQLTQLFGDEAKPVLAAYTQARADRSKELAWVDLMSDLVFRMPAIRLAEGQVRQGAPVWMYRFDWESP